MKELFTSHCGGGGGGSHQIYKHAVLLTILHHLQIFDSVIAHKSMHHTSVVKNGQLFKNYQNAQDYNINIGITN